MAGVVSCQKEDVVEVQQLGDTFTFTSTKPVLENGDTKTEWTGSTIQWSKNDKIRMAYTVAGVWQGASNTSTTPKLYASDGLEAATDMATFNINTSFTGTATGTHIFYGLYPSTLTSSTDFPNAPVASITIPAEQTPAANSFDYRADVMTGISGEFGSKPASNVLMVWKRQVAHADLTINNLSIAEGETLQKITLRAQNGADLVGVHDINIVTGEVSNPQGVNNEIVLKADNMAYSGNSIKAWASFLPATLTELTIIVETDKAYYTRSFTGFSREFKRNKRNTMTIGMSSAVREAKAYATEDFEESLYSSFGTFGIENKSLPSGLPAVWTIDNSYHCAKGTAYYNNTRYAATSYLVSPELMIGSENSTLTFDHAVNYLYSTSFSSLLSVVVRDGGEEKTLTLDKVPNSWTFVTATVDLSEYFGKTIQIAFKYTSTTSVAPTWEVKNVKITDVVIDAPSINILSANPISVGKAGGSQTISYSIVNPVSGSNLTATSDVSWISGISVNSSSVTFTVAAQATGASSRIGIITFNYPGASSKTVTISQEAGEGSAVAANGWLELPAQQTGNDFYNGVFKVGSARNYSYMYQYSTYTCLWVAYPLYKSVMSTSTVVPGPYVPEQMTSEELRAQEWNPNPNLAQGKQVNVWSYSYNVNYGDTNWSYNQGSEYYARGHQIPNGDRNLSSANEQFQTQTYYATNSTPQIQNKFNATIWAALEKAGRDCARGGGVNDTVYVVTGAVFSKVGETESVTYIHPRADSNKDVPVPNYYWKVFLKVKRSGNTITDAKAIGFWLKHQQYDHSNYSNAEFVKSVDQIEAWTGFNFFVNLPSSLEATAEANTSWSQFQNF